MRGRQIEAVRAVGNDDIEGAANATRRAGARAPRAAPGQLAAALAHEIRTPLAVALMYLRLVEDEAGPLVKESVREGFSIARAEVGRLDRLLTDLVDLQRVGHIVVHPTLVDAGRVVSDAVRRALRDLSGGQVTVELGASDLLDWWDASVIERLVETLVTTTAHQGEGRPVSVSVDRAAAALRICVRDGDHRGAVADASPRSFRRRLGPRKARAGAIDTSTSLVRELVEAHGGTLTAAPPAGSALSFTVILSPQRP